MQKTNIGWTDYTSNPVRAKHADTQKLGWACTQISPGCTHCYAETLNKRWGTRLPYQDAANKMIVWWLHTNELATLWRHSKPSRVFIGDMTDLFHERIMSVWLDQIFATTWNAHHVTHQILTKRAAKLRHYFTVPDRAQRIAHIAYQLCQLFDPKTAEWLTIEDIEAAVMLPLPNLHMGVSVENQRQTLRIAELIKTPAAVRFLSIEPLLEEVNIYPYLATHNTDEAIHWVIVGGESGTEYRAMRIEWLESLVDQCQVSGVKLWVKQDSGLYPGRQGRIPDRLWIQEVPDS